MRLTREVTETQIVCNYCGDLLAYPAVCYDGGTRDEVNLCSGYVEGGESCAQKWVTEQERTE